MTILYVSALDIGFRSTVGYNELLIHQEGLRQTYGVSNAYPTPLFLSPEQ